MPKQLEPRIDINKIDTLDQFVALTQPVGSVEQALSNNMFGINHEQVKGVLAENRDSYGLTFFTRPQLNFQTPNLRNIRQFYSLLTTKEFSVHRYVRNTLDPRLALNPSTKIKTPLVDNRMAFIPILTNNLKSISGWPDIVAPFFASKAGVRKEQWGIVDGTIDIYESFDIDATFRNVKNEPITLMMQSWLAYMSAVFEGMMSPYLDYIVNNRIDYNTRIYRLVLDESKRYVKKIAATGASFPVNVPVGKMFDYNDTSKYNDQTKDINIRFKCFGAIYNDEILIKEFNEAGGIFNRDIRTMLRKYSDVGEALPDATDTLAVIPNELLDKLNHRGYPVIDRTTYELKWYIDKSSNTYKEITNLIPNAVDKTGNPKYYNFVNGKTLVSN